MLNFFQEDGSSTYLQNPLAFVVKYSEFDLDILRNSECTHRSYQMNG